MKVNIGNENSPVKANVFNLKYGVAYQYVSENKTYTVISLSPPSELFPPMLMRFSSTGFEIIRLQEVPEAILHSWRPVQFTEYKGTLTLDYRE